VKKAAAVILSALLVPVVIPPLGLAQSLIAGDITGTVTDPGGAVVPNAKITLTNTGAGIVRLTKTNDVGQYRFAFVPPGNYTLLVEASGFAGFENEVRPNTGQAAIHDFSLMVGSSTQAVEVTSAAAFAQENTADIYTSFESELIQSLPNPGNDLTYIAQTTPGVNMNSADGTGNFQANGMPATSNLFTVNGQNAMNTGSNVNGSGASNLMLGRNELQEATITTNAYSGQFGQQASVQVNYVTKSGTNDVHGNAVYWWTGRAMDANDWFNNRTVPTTPRPFANNNQWAASIGGPIRKNKIFFFLDNEGIVYIVPSATTVFAPSPQFAAATLNNLATVSPASLPLYSKMFQLYEDARGYRTNTPVQGGGCQDFVPSFAGPCFVQFQANPAEPEQEWTQVGRLDVNFSAVDKAFLRFNIDHGTQATYADPVNSAFNVTSYQPFYNLQTQWTHVFGADATNSLLAASGYGSGIFTQDKGPETFPINVNMSALGYTSMANLENIIPQGGSGTSYQVIDDYSVVRGKHTFKIGVNWRSSHNTDYDISEGMHPEAYMNSVAQLYDGLAVEYLQNFPSRVTEGIDGWGIGIYVQDEWRATRNLTLTLALRAEKNASPTCQSNCASYLNDPFYAESTDPNTPYNSMIAANRHDVFPSTDAINWAPRFGFAWSIAGKTVVRAGVGVFYDAFPGELGDSFITNLPNVVDMTLCCAEYWADTTSAGAGASAAASAAAIKSGFANGASFNSLSSVVGSNFSAPSFYSLAGTLHTQQFQEWSLQLEQQLDNNSSMSLGYVGNHGIHIPVYNHPNFYGSGMAGVPTAPYSTSFATVSEIYTGGISNYNGVTASYKRQLAYGFQMLASFTWGHALDEVSNGGVAAYNPNSSIDAQVNPLCLACNNYGDADYDIRRSFNAAYVWTIPFDFHRRPLNRILGGWTVSQNFFGRSGLPFPVFDGTTFLPNFFFAPAQVIGSDAQMSCVNGNSQCVNPAEFESAAAYGAFPTQRRNMWRGPAFFDSDLSVNKNFKLSDQLAFQLGANLYNVFNHPNFANPYPILSNVNSAGIGQPGGNFGVITSTSTPPTTPYGSLFTGSPSGRIIQIQGKLVF
jgi:hypothetical protein